MGIEQFFGALSKTGARKIMIENAALDAECIMFDFNSIIHRVSQLMVDDLNHVMRLLANGRLKEANEQAAKYADLHLPALSTEHPYNIGQTLNAQTAVIQLVGDTILDYVGRVKECKHVLLAMDGVPGYGKMREQKHRRYLGEVTSAQTAKIVADAAIPGYADYYNSRISFSKSLITPGTQFMRDLCADLRTRVAVALGAVSFELSDFYEAGEGEMKIIDRLKTSTFKTHIVYSPDADMILLCAIQAGKGTHINLLRHDQRKQVDTLVNIELLRTYLAEAVEGDASAVEDLILMFSVFGDDFIPRLAALTASDHLTTVLNIYKKHFSDERMIVDGNVSINMLKTFFRELEPLESAFFSKGGSMTRRKRRTAAHKTCKQRGGKRWSSFIPDPFETPEVNTLHKKVHEFINLEGDYSAPHKSFTRAQYYKHYNIGADASQHYLIGLRWLYDYYYDGKLVNDWVYPYEGSPLIKDILEALDTITELPTVPAEAAAAQMSPMEHLIYVSPGNVTGEAENAAERTAAEAFYKTVAAAEPGWTDAVKIDCTNAPYRSKCRMEHVPVRLFHMKQAEFLGIYRNQTPPIYVIILKVKK